MADEFVLTADVVEYVPIFNDEGNVVFNPAYPDVGADPALAGAPVVDATPQGVADEDAPTPAPELTDEQSAVLAALATGESNLFDEAFLRPDGTPDIDLWRETWALENDLANNGIAPEDYLATATYWMLG